MYKRIHLFLSLSIIFLGFFYALQFVAQIPYQLVRLLQILVSLVLL